MYCHPTQFKLGSPLTCYESCGVDQELPSYCSTVTSVCMYHSAGMPGDESSGPQPAGDEAGQDAGGQQGYRDAGERPVGML